MARSEAVDQLRESKLPPVACTLDGEDLSAQVERWKRLGRTAGLSCATTANGLRLSFRDEPAVEAELRALVARERECCAWARWQIHREGGKLVLEVGASGHGVAALHAMLGAA